MPLPALAAPLIAKASTALATRAGTSLIAKHGLKGGLMRAAGQQLAQGALNKASQMGKSNYVGGGSSWMDANPNESHWG